MKHQQLLGVLSESNRRESRRQSLRALMIVFVGIPLAVVAFYVVLYLVSLI